MNNKKFILSLMALVIALTFTHPSFAAEIKGTVVAVVGKRAKIAYESDFAPREGDKVKIGYVDEDGDYVRIRGSWEIVDVDRNHAWADDKSGNPGTPEKDHIAKIASENPQKRSDLAVNAEKSVTKQSGGGYLGVGIGPLTPDLKKSLNIPLSSNGVHVQEITGDSAAEKAGIKKGDVITEFNGRQISSVPDLPRMVSALSPGTRVEIKVIREGWMKNMQVILGKRSDLSFLKKKQPDDSKQIEEQGLVYIPSLNAKVKELRFFESGFNSPVFGQREYKRQFPSSSSRYINWELHLEHPKPNRKIDFEITAINYRLDGSDFVRQNKKTYIKSNWTFSNHSQGWGWREPGNWKPDIYRIDLYIKSQKVASGSFRIE